MPKKVRTLLLIFPVLILASVLIGFALQSSFEFIGKSAMTAEEFKARMVSLGFTVADSIEGHTENGIVSAITATVRGGRYQIEFCTFETENTAFLAFCSDEKLARKMTGYASEYNGGSGNSVNPYGKEIWYTKTMYAYMAHLYKTTIYIVADRQYQGEIEKIIDQLGY